MDVLLFSDEDQALIERSLNYLQYLSVESARDEYDEESGLYNLYVADDDFEYAKEQLLGFLRQELRGSDADLEEEDSEEEETEHSSVSYEELKAKYDDTKSSAYILFVFGAVGLIALAFEFCGIFTIPISSNVKTLFYITMAAMFIAFLVGGLLSLNSAKRLRERVAEAGRLKEQLNYFTAHDIKKEEIDGQISSIETLSVEELYFERARLLRDKLASTFTDADPAYLDAMVDDVYQELYPE